MTFARSFSTAYDQLLTGLKLFLGTFYQFLAINNVELSNCKSIFITQLNVHNNQKVDFLLFARDLYEDKKDWG